MKLPALALLLFAVAPVAAHDIAAGSLTIGHPFAYPTAPGAMSGAGYLTITNAGDAPDRLIAVRADFPGVSLHRTEVDANGVARMLETRSIEIAPGATIALKPGGDHVMFVGIEADPFEPGDVVAATLVFEKAGEVPVEFWVEERQAGQGAGHAAAHGHADLAAGAGHAHGGHTQAAAAAEAAAGLSDAAQIEALLKAQFDRPDAPLEVTPIVTRGDAAVAGWSQEGSGGRAFLRRGAQGWRVELCSGASLREAATLVALGLPPIDAEAIAVDLAAAEAGVPGLSARLDAFEGTIVVGGGDAQGH